ncbi:MAG TPA: LysR family transcriptional regulator [Thermohalobaculum sp.]|nr:LysR family transcriptional regulator [Thermohalobaculum sp.]
MEMHQIRYFLAVSRLLNFTRAAEECNVAQPSLTRAIKKLEDELGGELFRRERRNTHVTELGRLMLPLLSQAYDGALSAKSLAGSYGVGDHAPLSLAISKTVNIEHLIGPIAELSRALPGLSLNFFRGTGVEILEKLKSGDIELAVAGRFETEWDRLNAWPLFTEGFALMVNKRHPLAQQDRLEIGTLAGEVLLAWPYSEEYLRLGTQLRENGIDVPTSHQMAAEDDVFAMLEAGIGVAILPRNARRPDSICAIEVDGLDIERTVYLYEVAGRRHLPAVAGLVRIIRAGGVGQALAT